MSPFLKVTAALAVVAVGSTAIFAAKPTAHNAALTNAVASAHRSDANRARDKYRNPVQTLQFFGVKPNHKVVELWPGGGWYTEILAPYLAKDGSLIVAPPLARTDRIKTVLSANPTVFGKVQVATFPMVEGGTAVAPGSADVVLTFRNVHNWRFDGTDAAQSSFNAIFTMLKPGGVLGIVDHRLPEKMDTKLEEKSGYMKRSSILAYARKAGFKLAGESGINANPKDTHDWEKGVWTLPPVYRLGETDKAKYTAIGESDRLTMKFVKPKK